MQMAKRMAQQYVDFCQQQLDAKGGPKDTSEFVEKGSALFMKNMEGTTTEQLTSYMKGGMLKVLSDSLKEKYNPDSYPFHMASRLFQLARVKLEKKAIDAREKK